MPELPEVETTVTDLRPQLVGQRIIRAEIFWARTVAEPDASAFEAQVAGCTILGISRRGKYLVFALDDGLVLICHLRMTGRLRIEGADSQVLAGPHVRARFELGNGRYLVFTDARKFGRLWLVADPDAVLHKLGMEPLAPGFAVDDLAKRVTRRRVAVKALLLDQAVVAGLGNIYADEALFRAGIHPLRTGSSLNSQELARLHDAIVEVLQAAVIGRGTTLRDYKPPLGERGNYQNELQVYQRTDQPCLRCGAPIRRIRVTQRSTHFCPLCQS